MTSRYCFCPMTAKRIGRRMTPADRFRRWMRIRRDRKNGPDVFMVTGFYPAYVPRK